MRCRRCCAAPTPQLSREKAVGFGDSPRGHGGGGSEPRGCSRAAGRGFLGVSRSVCSAGLGLHPGENPKDVQSRQLPDSAAAAGPCAHCSPLPPLPPPPPHPRAEEQSPSRRVCQEGEAFAAAPARLSAAPGPALQGPVQRQRARHGGVSPLDGPQGINKVSRGGDRAEQRAIKTNCAETSS